MGTKAECLERNGSYCTSTCEESFYSPDRFVTKEDAIEFGRAEDHQYVGMMEVPDPTAHVSVVWLMEHILEQEDFEGDWWEGYLSDGVSVAQLSELQTSLQDVFGRWLDKYEHWPESSNIVDVEPIPDVEDSEGGAA